MLRVEALENDRSASEVNTDAAKPYYFKENRFYFRVINKFTDDGKSPFLLVDTLNRELNQVRYASPPELNPNLRYYEAALDNYTYSRGTLTYNGPNSFTINDPEDSLWGLDIGTSKRYRVHPGDRIRFQNPVNYTWTKWNVVSSSSFNFNSTTGYVSSFNTVNNLESSIQTNFSAATEIKYVVQRAFTDGYSDLSWSYTADLSSAYHDDADHTVTINLSSDSGMPTSTELIADGIINVGDWFKVVDEGSYVQIADINTPSDYIMELELKEAYPIESILIMHRGQGSSLDEPDGSQRFFGNHDALGTPGTY
ncbi:MAG: hypothetical protein HQL32_06250, partial [Planctomycetes bacterium]|nr:hypothetical protein [Planctomycetota bacterium]